MAASALAQASEVYGMCRWVVPLDANGCGVASINGTLYRVKEVRLAGQLAGYTLAKGGGTVYEVFTAGPRWKCNCPDFTYRRKLTHGGCKHAAALRALVAALGDS